MMYVIQTGHGKYFQRRGCVLSTHSVLPTFYETKEAARQDIQSVRMINTFVKNKGVDNGSLEEPEIIEWEVG